jgi:predicted ATPase
MIKNINIKNFKCLKDINLSLSNLNILTGMNGMGKSSVLQTLFLTRTAFKSDSYFQYLYLKNRDFSFGKSQDILYQNAVNDIIDFNFIFSHTILNLEYQAIADKDYLKMDKTKFIDFEEYSHKKNLINESLFNNRFQYLNSNLITPTIFHESNDFLVNEEQNIGIHGEFTIHYLDLNGSRKIINKSLKHPKLTSYLLKTNVEAWLSEISPGVRLSITSIPGDPRLILQFQFETGTEMTNKFSPLNVGFGINYVVPIITALLTAEKDKLIIIESPEAYLHPKGQSKIGELAAIAAQTGAQIIIETHSDHVINGIRVATKKSKIEHENIKFYYFDRNTDSKEHYSFVHEMKIDSDGRLDYWPDGFMDEWDKNLMELI